MLAPLAEDPGQLDELLAPIAAVHQAVTPAAMSPERQLDEMVAALDPLAAVMADGSDELDPEAWSWDGRRLAIADGFAHALTLAELVGRDAPEPPLPWRSETEPESYAAGRQAAERFVVPRVILLLPFKFPGDRAAIESCREQQRDLPPDDQLDELGWEIYLLVRARGGEHGYAVEHAMDGTLRERQRVRDDLTDRARATVNSAAGPPAAPVG